MDIRAAAGKSHLLTSFTKFVSDIAIHIVRVPGPLLIYLYKRPTATETHGNHIFCLKKSTNLLYGMNLVWNGPWLT